MIVVKREYLIGVGVVAVLFALTIGVPWLSAERGVDRAWHGLLDDIEGNDIENVAAVIDAEYADAWGLKREEVVKVVETMRRQFLTCSITRDAGRADGVGGQPASDDSGGGASGRDGFAGGADDRAGLAAGGGAHDVRVGAAVVETVGLDAGAD